MKAEKKEKARNIVEGALDRYIELYGKYFEIYKIKLENNFLIFNDDIYKIMFLNIREDFLTNAFIESKILFNSNQDIEFFIKRLNFEQRKIIIEKYIKKLNLRYSIYGIVSGVFSTDFIKGV